MILKQLLEHRHPRDESYRQQRYWVNAVEGLCGDVRSYLNPLVEGRWGVVRQTNETTYRHGWGVYETAGLDIRIYSVLGKMELRVPSTSDLEEELSVDLTYGIRKVQFHWDGETCDWFFKTSRLSPRVKVTPESLNDAFMDVLQWRIPRGMDVSQTT